MENFYEAHLLFTARLAFSNSQPLSSELVGHLQKALERTLEQIARDNGFLFDAARVCVNTKEEGVL